MKVLLKFAGIAMVAAVALTAAITAQAKTLLPPLSAMSRLMLKSAKRASLIENLRSLRGLGKMRVR